MKVYCKNCKWDGGGIIIGDYCQYELRFMGTYETGEGIIKKKNRNKNGNCKCYNRKWYKFWVKEK